MSMQECTTDYKPSTKNNKNAVKSEVKIGCI